MFGTIARLRVKQGKEQDLIAQMQEWDRVHRPKIAGAVAGCLYRSEQNPNDMTLVAIFQDRESYYANANDPEQDRWYQKLRSCLESDPTLVDGEQIGTWGAMEAGGTQTRERGK